MNQTREQWSSRFGFLTAAIGSAIGLGVLWKFPYTVGQNGGGLFLLSYFACLILIGLPLLIAELVLGRQTQRAAVGAFELLDKKKSGWKLAGWFGVLASFLIMSFYSVISGWGLSYILTSLIGGDRSLSQDPAQTFFHLSTSGEISLFWHFLLTLITVSIVLSGIRKGIEKWAKVMTKALLVLLTLLFIYATTLKGFGKAARFVFYPNLVNFKLSSLIEALGLAFFTLSIGQGIMISYGSYMKKDQSIVKLAGVVCFSVVIVSILAALTIFPVVFTFGLSPEEGYGLIFKTLPHLFEQLPGSTLLSTMFFTLFVFTALTSAIPLIEVVASNLMELYQMKRKKAGMIVGIACFILGIPSAYANDPSIFPNWSKIYGLDFLQTVDNFVSIWIIPIAGLLSAIFVGWIMEKRVSEEAFLREKRLKFLFYYWRGFMRYLIPAIIIIIIIQKSGLYNFDLLLHHLFYTT